MTCYDDLNPKYYVIDQTVGRICTTTCKTREEAKTLLSLRIVDGSIPGDLFVVLGEKLAFKYQKNVIVKFEDEATDP